jgi:integrase
MVVDGPADPATGKRRQIRRRYKTADEAIEDYAKIKKETSDGTYVGRSTLTVQQACDNWLAGRHRIRPSTLAGYQNWLKPVVRAYGETPVQRLTKQHLDDLIPLLQAGGLPRADGKPGRPWKARSVNAMLGTIEHVLEDALKQGLIVRNVGALVDRLPQAKSKLLTYTAAEAKCVLAAARSDELEVAWHLALYGMRRGEVAGLRWSSVDLTAKTLTVELARVTVNGQATVSEPKTESGKRTLPITPQLLDVLTRTKRRQAANRLRAGAEWTDSGYVVVNELGVPLYPDTLSDKWDDFVRAAGVRRIRLHDARHTCGTLMHLQGVPIAVISAWLGHSDPSFTMRTYVHSQTDALLEAATALGVATGLPSAG